MGSQNISLKMNDSEFSSTTSNPRGSESFSLFSDGLCGEPLMVQHLEIDFTPLEDLDNDYVQRKCCAFWECINSYPELQNLMVLPESNIYRANFETSSSSSEQNQTRSLKITEPTHEHTAVSLLEIVEEKGLIDRTFEAKLPQSRCSLGSREYHENETTETRDKRSSQQDTVCICSGSCLACNQWHANECPAASPVAVDLCRNMQEWDIEHPKCMDPPGHPPALSRCTMQRKDIS